MKKTILFYLIVLSQYAILFAQDSTNDNKITGKLIATSDGLTIGSSITVTKDTDINFEYDGEALSVELSGKIFKDVTLSAGFAIQPDGEKCVYMSVSEGVELGALDFFGANYADANAHGSLAKVKSNGTLEASMGGKVSYCINWINNKPLVFNASKRSYQRVLILPNVAQDLFSILHGLEFDPEFAVTYSRESNIGFNLDSNAPDKILESYCMDKGKDVPYNQPLTYNPKTIPDYYDHILEGNYTITSKEDIGNAIWNYERQLQLKELIITVSEKHIQGIALHRGVHSGRYFELKLGLDQFTTFSIYYFPKEDHQDLQIEEFIKKKVLLYQVIFEKSEEYQSSLMIFLSEKDRIITYRNTVLEMFPPLTLENGDTYLSYDSNELIKAFIQNNNIDFKSAIPFTFK